MKAEKTLSEYTVIDIEGYEGIYAVTNCGRIYSHSRVNRQGRLQKGRWMKLQPDKDGYLKVRLQKDGISTYQGVHRHVATAFNSNYEELPVVNHIDEDKTNNSSSNLEWCTVAYNNAYSKAHSVKLLSPSGLVVHFTNIRQFSIRHGLDQGHIGKVLSGERQSHKGYKKAY